MKPPDKHSTHKHANQSFAGRLSMMLHSKHVATLGHTRQPAASLRITPFKPACSSKHSVCVRAAATDAVEEAPEAVQDEVDIALEPLFIEDVEAVVARTYVEVDDDTRDAIKWAEQMAESFAAEVMAESTLGTGNVERAQQLLEAAMSGTGMLGKSASALINTAAERLSEEATDLTEAGVEDFQPPSSGKYDEEEEASLSEDKRNAVQSLKLTRQELSSLVPPDWDTVNLEWFSNKKDEAMTLPHLRLNCLWLSTNLAVAVDQVYSRGQISPLTEYYVWPRKDAWEEMRIAMDARHTWLPDTDRVLLLNRLTDVINFWQSHEPNQPPPPIEAARAAFPDCSFTS